MVLAAAAAVIGNQLFSSSSSSSKPDRVRRADPDLPRGYVRFRDRREGVSIAHPSDWIRLPRQDPQVKLLAVNAGASLLLRVQQSNIEIGPQNLGPAERITNKLMENAGPVKLVRDPQLAIVGGLPGYLYVDVFRDRATGQRGAHARYFLFWRKKIITLVFQALPSTSFRGLAPTFDKIKETLRVRGVRPDAAAGR